MGLFLAAEGLVLWNRASASLDVAGIFRRFSRGKGSAQVWSFLGSLVSPTEPGTRKPQEVLVGEWREIIKGEGPEQLMALEPARRSPTSKP